jgi:hypothetical protein
VKYRSVIVAWDFGAAILCSAVAAVLLPKWVPSAFAQDIFRISVSVSSVLFSIFFAALALIISSSNDEFIAWIEEATDPGEESDYQIIVAAFRFSLFMLFSALIVGLCLFGYTSFRIANTVDFQHKAFVSVFAFLFSYGLFCAISSLMQAIKFSSLRSQFAALKKGRCTHNVPK